MVELFSSELYSGVVLGLPPLWERGTWAATAQDAGQHREQRNAPGPWVLTVGGENLEMWHGDKRQGLPALAWFPQRSSLQRIHGERENRGEGKRGI